MTRGRLILRMTVLAVFAVLVVGHVAGQIIVPDRLQGGTRMGALVTPADQCVLIRHREDPPHRIQRPRHLVASARPLRRWSGPGRYGPGD